MVGAPDGLTAAAGASVGVDLRSGCAHPAIAKMLNPISQPVSLFTAADYSRAGERVAICGRDCQSIPGYAHGGELAVCQVQYEPCLLHLTLQRPPLRIRWKARSSESRT